jgi:hypothetical protein
MMMMSIDDLPEADGKEAEIHAHASCSIKKKKRKRFESRQERKTCTPRIRQIQIPHQRGKKTKKERFARQLQKSLPSCFCSSSSSNFFW